MNLKQLALVECDYDTNAFICEITRLNCPFHSKFTEFELVFTIPLNKNISRRKNFWIECEIQKYRIL